MCEGRYNCNADKGLIKAWCFRKAEFMQTYLSWMLKAEYSL